MIELVIDSLDGWEVLDSRGRPTVAAACTLRGGFRGIVSVPSGASVGAGEAVELRDGDASRYGGLGCKMAAANIARELAATLVGHAFVDQAAFDAALIAADGTPDKRRLGANALLAVSVAFARATAHAAGVPFFAHLASIVGTIDGAHGNRPETVSWLPRPMINLFSGGKHAGGQVELQDVLVVPLTAGTVDQALADMDAIYTAAVALVHERYGMRELTADEGGLAPPFGGIEEMIDAAVTSIERAGLEPDIDVALALDVAASHLLDGDGAYRLSGESLDPTAMIERLVGWLDDYPILSLEDGLAENDWDNWPLLRARIAGRAALVGDDLLCTSPSRIERAVSSGACDALLLKVNQVGTLSEAATALRVARAAGWAVVVSARSGETEDDWLADLAVGWAGDLIKVGSIRQSDRLAKYNRLLAIERETGAALAPLVIGNGRA